MSQRGRPSSVGVVLAAVCLLCLAAGSAAAGTAAGATGGGAPSDDATSPASAAVQTVEPSNGTFRVALKADGDADVRYTDELNLSDDEERREFEEIRDNETHRAVLADRREEEMAFVSAQANEHVDRELRVGEVTVETETRGDVGVVAYRFAWENLAAVDGERVVLAEPFSLYDELDRELVVVAPAGYELTAVDPDPAQRNATTASWPALTDLSGFEVVAEGEGAGADGGVGDGDDGDGGVIADGPGLGPGVAAAALLLAATLARRRLRA